MPRARVYLPLSPAQLSTLDGDRRLGGSLPGYTVTPGVRTAFPGVSDEEVLEQATAEFAALYAAALDQPVVVGAVDVTPGVLRPAGDPAPATDEDALVAAAHVEVTADVALSDVAAFLVGDDVTQGATERAQPDEFGHIPLSWYDATELAEVLRLLG